MKEQNPFDTLQETAIPKVTIISIASILFISVLVKNYPEQKELFSNLTSATLLLNSFSLIPIIIVFAILYLIYKAVKEEKRDIVA